MCQSEWMTFQPSNSILLHFILKVSNSDVKSKNLKFSAAYNKQIIEARCLLRLYNLSRNQRPISTSIRLVILIQEFQLLCQTESKLNLYQFLQFQWRNSIKQLHLIFVFQILIRQIRLGIRAMFEILCVICLVLFQMINSKQDLQL